MSLDFCYSIRCTRHIKLSICISTCVIIYLCSTVQALSPVFTGMSIAIGMGIHGLSTLSLKITEDNPYKTGFNLLFFVLPLMTFITLILVLPTQHKIMLAIQVIGFTTIGLLIVSTFPKRRVDQDEQINLDETHNKKDRF